MWVKVTGELLLEQPAWLYQPLWVSCSGVVDSGRYEWRQGRYPDRIHCDSNGDLHALECHIMPLVKPEPPATGSTNTTPPDSMELERAAIVRAMSEVADKYAHRMAMLLECIVMSVPSGTAYWDEAMAALDGYRGEMNAIHEQDSPTHMGEPALRHNAEMTGAVRDDCPVSGLKGD